MKKLDPNNFIIDRVFDSIEKYYKKKNKKDKKKNKKDKSKVMEEPDIITSETNDNEYYTITINV